MGPSKQQQQSAQMLPSQATSEDSDFQNLMDNLVDKYRPVPVTPTSDYPFSTDAEFLHNRWKRNGQKDDNEDQRHEPDQFGMTREDIARMTKNWDKTIGMNIEGEEVEVPADIPGLSPYEANLISGTPQNTWPKYLLDKIESYARDQMEQGRHPLDYVGSIGF